MRGCLCGARRDGNVRVSISSRSAFNELSNRLAPQTPSGLVRTAHRLLQHRGPLGAGSPKIPSPLGGPPFSGTGTGQYLGDVTMTSPTTSPRHRARFDRSVLVSNVVAGALWLLLPAALRAWPLSLIGALYVGAASLFLAAVYSHQVLGAAHEALAWAAPWLAAVGLWAVLIGEVEFGESSSHGFGSVLAGLVVGTLCFLCWQGLALAIRQFLAWRNIAPSQRP